MTRNNGNDADGKSKIIDFQEIRDQKLQEKRKSNERVFIREMLGIFCVMENEKMKPIEILDVSEQGLSFQVAFDSQDPWPRDVHDLKIRLYFSQSNYLPLVLKIQNSRPGIDRGIRIIRYGCSIDSTTTTFEVYQQFVRFLKLFSLHAHKEEGGVSHFFI